MSESVMVTVETRASARLHLAVQEGDYLVRWPELLPSRQKDIAVDWCATTRLWDLPLGAFVKDEDDIRTYRVTATGLETIQSWAALDALDPAGAEARAVRSHLKIASRRFMLVWDPSQVVRDRRRGGIENGVHAYETPEGVAVIHAEKATAKQAWIRAATREEAEAAGFRFVVGEGRVVTVLSLADGGAHALEGAGAGPAPSTRDAAS